jgi:diaminopimelate epimerase
MRLARYHGLGNDYLVAEVSAEAAAWWCSDAAAAAVKALCDRHTGVGSDGLLVPFGSARADVGVAILNPDGSRAEKSGNGLRILSAWAVATGAAAASHTVDTGFDVVSAEVGTEDVTVAMGRATTAPEAVPLVASGPVVDAVLPLPEVVAAGRALPPAVVLSVGNPHCVVFVEGDLDAAPWRVWGEAVERHPAFPRRTNVQFAQVVSSEPVARVALRIWERGAGPTQASGSSASAVAAAAVLTQRLPCGWVRAEMPGGALDVHVADDLRLTLRGPVERVGEVTVDPGWLARRGVPALAR